MVAAEALIIVAAAVAIFELAEHVVIPIAVAVVRAVRGLTLELTAKR